MITTVVVDTTPLGLLAHEQGQPEADACRVWMASMVAAGVRIMVPEIADYELRREFIRSGNALAIVRLDRFNAAEPDRYVPITTVAMRRAAELWAQARNAGVPTAECHALDADVIVAAQALTPGVSH